MNRLAGVLLVVWTFLPLLALPLGLLTAMAAAWIRSDQDVGRKIAAFSIAMLLDIPVRGIAMALDQIASNASLWPVGYGLLALLYAGASAGLLMRRRKIVDRGLSRLRVHGTEHEPGLRAGAEAGLSVLAVYFALQPAVILLVNAL